MKRIFMLWTLAVLLCAVATEAFAQQRPPVFREDFNDLWGGIPQGWNNDSVVGTAKWVADRNGCDSTGCLSYSKFVGDYQENVLIMPTLKLDGDMMVAFDYKITLNVGMLNVYLSYDGGKTFDEKALLNLTGDNLNSAKWSHIQTRIPKSPTGNVTIAFQAVGSGYGSPKIYLDNVVVDYASRCAAPVNLMVSGMTGNSVSLDWGYSDMGADGSHVDVILFKDGEVVLDMTEELQTFGSIRITGLEPSTEYEVKVRMNCEDSYLGRSDWSDILKFTTSCSSVNPNISYNFDNDTKVSECWLVKREDTKSLATVYPSTLVTYGGTGKSLEIPKGNKDQGDTYVFTEAVDHEANDLEISVMAYNNNQKQDEILEIGIQGDLYVSSTYCKLKEIVLKPKTWTHIVVYTDDVILGNQKNASVVLWTKDLETASVFVDNLEINTMPACRVPEDVKLVGLYPDGVEFSWKQHNGVSLEVYDVTNGNETFLGTLANSGDKLALSDAVLYNFRFKASCNGSSKSNWGTDEITVRIPCSPRVPDYTMDFESGTMPDCWSNDGVTTVDGKTFKWSVQSVSGVYSVDGQSQYALVSPTGVAGANGVCVPLVLPYMTIPEADEYMLEFYIYRKNESSSATDRINVYVNEMPVVEGATKIGSVARKSTSSPVTDFTGWERYECLIPVKGNVYIILESDIYNAQFTYIDNVSVKEKISCMSPTEIRFKAIGSSTATIEWTSRSTAQEYIVTTKLRNVESVDTVRGINEYTIQGLTPNTNYGWVDVSVRSVCAENDSSDVAKDRLILSTVCGAIDIPYKLTNTLDWKCFTVLRSSGSYPSGGTTISFMGYSNMFAMPEFNYENVSGLRVAFDYNTYDEGILEVGTIASLETWEMFNVVDTVIGSNLIQHYSSEIGSTTDKYIAFRYTGKTGKQYSKLSNIMVDMAPACPDVQRVITEEVGANSARFDIWCQGIEHFEVEYGKRPLKQGTGTTVEVGSDFTLSELEPNTDYDLYVRSLCDAGEGVWISTAHQFKTLCDNVNITVENSFFDGFEYSVDLGCWVSRSDSYQWGVSTNSTNAYEGQRFALLSGSGNSIYSSDLFYALDLHAGVKYEFSCYVRLNAGYADGISLSAGYCNGLVTGDDNVVTFINKTPVTNNDGYVKLSALFTPQSDATHIRIRGAANGRYGIRLDNVSVSIVSCDYPDFVLTQLSDTNVVISWRQMLVNGYNLKVSSHELVDIDNETADMYDGMLAASATEQEVTGLQPSNEYYVYMRSTCGEGNSSRWTDVLKFTTLCNEVIGDFNESFEGVNPLSCWRWNDNNKVSIASVAPYDGLKCCSVGEAGKQTTLATPAIGNLEGKMLRMFVKAANSNATVSIGVTNVAVSPIFFYPLTTVAVADDGWNEVICYIFNLDENDDFANSKHIVISTDNQCYIDAIRVTDIDVSGCVQPANAEVFDIGDVYAEIDWSMYEEKPCSVIVKQGETVVQSLLASSHPFRIESLLSNTEYTVDVATKCDEIESQAYTVKFKTKCGAVAFGYSEDFDNVEESRIPECWADTAKSGSNPYAAANKWSAVANVLERNVMQFSSSSNNTKGNGSRLQTPEIDLTSVNAASLFFFMRSTDARAVMSVVVSIDGGTTFTDTVMSGIAFTEWTNIQCNLTKYCGKKVVLGFHGVSAEVQNAYIYIDDVHVAEPRECDATAMLKVESVNGNTVTIAVTDEIGSAWEIAVGKFGFNPDNVTPSLLTDKEGVVSGVPSSSLCEAYIRVRCDDSGYSAWSKPVRFTSDCVAMTVPFRQDMENLSAIADLTCFNAGECKAVTELVDVEKVQTVSGSKSLKFKNTASVGYLLLPEFDADVENLVLEFKYRYTGANAASFEIGVVHKDSTDVCYDKFVPVSKTCASTTVATATYSLTAAQRTGNNYRIGLKVPALTDGAALSIDDISVRELVGFFAPVDVMVTGVTDHSAMVSWRAPAQTAYSEISINGDYNNPVVVNAEVTSHLLTSLVATSVYTVNVRCVDGNGQKSEWSIPVQFMTNGTAAQIPYVCDFEADEADNVDLWSFTAQGGTLYWAVSGKDNSGVYSGERALYVANGFDTLHTYNEPAYSINAKNQQADAYLMMNLASGTYNLSFKYHSECNSGDKEDYLRVLLIPKATGATSVSGECMILEPKINNVKPWTLFDKQFYIPEDGYYQLVFKWSSRSEYFKAGKYKPTAIDSLVVREIVCPPLLSLSADSISATSARIFWTDNNKASANYEYVLAKGDELFDENKAQQGVAGQKFVKFTVEPESDYTVWVRTVCNANNTSEWSEPHNFHTPCTPVAVNAGNTYADGFENYTATDLDCWEHSAIYTGRWNAVSTTEPVSSEGDRCISIAANKEALIFRRLNLTAGLNYRMRFDASQSIDEYNGTKVKVIVCGEFDDVADAVVVYEEQLVTSEYTEHTARFNVPSDGVYLVGIYGKTIGSTKYLAVDNLNITTVDCDMPTLLNVKDIAAESATVTWSGTAEKYMFKVYRGGLLQLSEEITGCRKELMDLYSVTKYTVSVSSICADGEESAVALTEFTTDCGGIAPVPYTETFEDGVMPKCWIEQSSSAAKWSGIIDGSGNGMMRFDSQNGAAGSKGLLTTPAMGIEENGYRLTFDYMNPAGGPLNVMVTTDGGKTYADTLLAGVTKVGMWTTLSVSLDKYTGNKISIVAEGTSNFSLRKDAYICIDNFSVRKVSEKKTVRDTVCYGDPYMENGFEIPVVNNYGDNVFQRVAVSSKAEDHDTLYEATVYVPNTDYYITDVYIQGETYTKNGFDNGITQPGHDYTMSLKSTVTGCDSIIHLALLEMNLDVVIIDTICEGAVYDFCNEELTESCTRTCVAQNKYGLDSTTVLHLTVLPSLMEHKDTICQGDFIEFDGKILTETGVYEADSTYSNGCTYQSRLTLTVIDSLEVREATICQGSYVDIEGKRYDTEGMYRIVLAQENGCQRVLKLDLIVTPTETVTYNTIACEGKPIYYPGFAGIEVDKDTILFRTSSTKEGCDSVTCLVVDYHKTVETFDTVYTTEQVYTCDNGETLVSTGDCESVGQTADGCDSIHRVHVIFSTGVENVKTNELLLTPNPAKTMTAIYADGDWSETEMTGMTIEILDIAGRIVYRGEVCHRPVAIEGLPQSGMYVVRVIDSDGRVYMGKLIVE